MEDEDKPGKCLGQNETVWLVRAASHTPQAGALTGSIRSPVSVSAFPPRYPPGVSAQGCDSACSTPSPIPGPSPDPPYDRCLRRYGALFLPCAEPDQSA